MPRPTQEIKINREGVDGNAFSVLGAVAQAMRNGGVDQQDIDIFFAGGEVETCCSCGGMDCDCEPCNLCDRKDSACNPEARR